MAPTGIDPPRHQIYLIARVTPHGQPLSETRYRCIAALQCDGYMSLESTTCFMTCIKQKENAEIIREEIRSIHGLYGTFRKLPQPPRVPCPLAHFLMYSALTDLSIPNYRVPEVLPARMGTMEGNSNQGIIIIDVTDPESPAYCLVFVQPSRTRPNVPLKIPLSATQYLRAYYNHPEPYTSKVLTTLHLLESVPMITIDMLAEAWPGEYIPDPSGLSLESKALRPTFSHILPSLVALTFVPALNHALQTGEMDRLDPVIWLPRNVSKIKEVLRARSPMTAVDFALLTKILLVTQTKSIDLSHFSLTGEQVIQLLSAQGVEVLNLSHMQHITTDTLRKLIPILPKLRRLVLLYTIPDTDILSLLAESPELFYHIDSFIHLAFLRPPDQVAFPFAFSHIITRGRRHVSMVSLPYFTSNQLVQGLTDFFSIPNVQYMHPKLLPLAVYASAVREPGRSWAERIVPFIPGMEYHRKFNEREGWLLAWLAPEHHYAFAKFDKEAMEECHQRINELRSLSNHASQVAGEVDAMLEDDPSTVMASLSDEEIHVKEVDIRSEYIDREFRIFDIESFFQELVKEGRPAPSPEALTNLLELFVRLGEENRPRGLRIMTQAGRLHSNRIISPSMNTQLQKKWDRIRVIDPPLPA